MAVVTPSESRQAARLQPQRISPICITRRRRTVRLAVLYLLIIALGTAAAVWAYHHFQPAVFTHPGFEPAAVAGQPQVEERYGYSSLQVDEGYEILLCGVPANDGRTVDFYFTNPASNTIWFRAEVLDETGEVIGSTGVLRQGEYLASLTLSRALTDAETSLTVRIVAYEPESWQSRGSVRLNLTVYQNFT